MSKLAKAITDLSPEQRTLLELRLMEKRANMSRLEKIPRRPDSNTFPLSSAQQRLWSLDQLVPEGAIYNIHTALRLYGSLDAAVLEQSLTQILQRHETLRAAFTNIDGRPVQLISPPEPFSLSIVDLHEFSETEREAKALWLARQEAQCPFDLARGALLRATLLRLGREEHVLLLTMHHIVSDGWSFGVFMRELGVLYATFSAGQPSPLPELPIQYADFAYCQQQWLQSPALEAQLTYWTQQLGGSPPPLQLPADRPPPLTPTHHGAHQSLAFSADLPEALKRLSRQEEATLFMTLLAAFQALLNRYTGQEDIIVCSPIAGRKRVETEGLIGYFNNIMVLRTDLSGNPSFRELLGRVRHVVLGAYDHQDVPFQQVANLPNLARIPLSRALFALQDSLVQLELPGIVVQSLDVESQTADFDIALFIEEKAEKLIGVLRYKTDLFSATTITWMLSRFQMLLESIVGDPEQQLLSLPRLTDTKPHQLIDELSATSNSNEDYHVLPAPDAFRHGVEEPFVAPRDELELRLTKIWEKVLAIQPVGVRDNFFSLGGHSLLALRLFVEIEKVTHKNLPLATLFQAPTIEQLTSALRNEGWSDSWSSLVPIQPAGSKPPFFCIHAHGGNVVGYYDLARHLGADQPFYGLQAQGLSGETVGFRRLEEMAAHYIEEIRTIQPHGPYFLGGYCFGGEVAYEMAQQLRAQKEEVALLALIESTHPAYPTFLPTTTPLHRLIYRVIARIEAELSNFYAVKPAAKLAYTVARSQRILTWMRLKVGLLMERLLTTLHLSIARSGAYALGVLAEAHVKAYMNYEPRPYHGRVILLRTSKQPLGIYPDPTLGWGELLAGDVELQEVPGHLIGLLIEPRVQLVAEQLRAGIATAQNGTSR